VHGRELAESLQLVIEYDPQPPSTPARRPKPMPARYGSRSGSFSAIGRSEWPPKSTAMLSPHGSAERVVRSPTEVNASTRRRANRASEPGRRSLLGRSDDRKGAILLETFRAASPGLG
jgi:hypothetical protein